MPDLPEVTQEFTANVQPYIDALARASVAAKAFADDATKAGIAAGVLGIDAQTAAQMLEVMTQSETLLIGQSNLLNSILREVSDANFAVSNTATDAAAMLQILSAAEAAAAEQATRVAAASTAATGAMKSMGATAAATSAVMRTMGRGTTDAGLFGPGILSVMQKERVEADALAASVKKASDAAGGANASFRIWGTGIRLTGNAIHWLVMGTGEILSTAIPALVALTAAGVAMYPTFVRIYDQMNNLVVASGSLRGALLNSVGPLHVLGQNFGMLANAVKPDAYIIFGATINSLTGHFGAFSQVAQQASNVLAAFASKLSAELSGSLGQQVVGFFRDAVNYMVQWGQVLGNLAHAFLNFFGDLAGVGKLLLDVLVAISAALVAITGNPIGAWIITIVAGISALYRYAQLLLVIFGFLNRALIAPFVGAVKWIIMVVQDIMMLTGAITIAGTEVTAFEATMAVLQAEMGPIGWAMLALGAVVGLFVLAAHSGQDATDKLIASVQKGPNTVAGLTNSFNQMTKALQQLPKATQQMTPEMARFGYQAGSAFNGAGVDANKLITQIQKTANQLVNLDTGMAEAGIRTGALGSYMQVLAISTAISDSKIQQLNQAIDQYVGLLTGGMNAMANFTVSMSNLATGTNNVTNLLGRNGSVTLSVKEFANTLNQSTTAGAQAWLNFNNVITGSMQPLADWFRTAASLGAASAGDVRTAVLSMVAVLGQYASKSQAAQAILMGFASANGVTARNFQDLMNKAHNAGGSLSTLTGITSRTTIAMSHLSQLAKNVAQALSTQATAALATAALQASGFNKALQKLQTDMQNSQPPNVIHQDLLKVSQALQDGQKLAVEWGNQVNTSMSGTASSTTGNTGTMSRGFDNAKLHQVYLEQKVNSSSGVINQHTGNVASTTQANMARTAGAFDTARQHAQLLQQYLNSMHGITITNHVNWVVQSPPPGAGVPGVSNPVHPFHGGVYGYQTGGVVGAGRMGMDRIPAMLTLGEGILTNAAVSAVGGPLGVRNLNDNPHLFHRGPPGGGGVINLTIISPVHIDGKTVGSSQRTQTLIYNRRNPSNNLDLRVR